MFLGSLVDVSACKRLGMVTGSWEWSLELIKKIETSPVKLSKARFMIKVSGMFDEGKDQDLFGKE